MSGPWDGGVKFERDFANETVAKVNGHLARVVLSPFGLREGEAHAGAALGVLVLAFDHRAVATFQADLDQLETLFDDDVERGFLTQRDDGVQVDLNADAGAERKARLKKESERKRS